MLLTRLGGELWTDRFLCVFWNCVWYGKGKPAGGFMPEKNFAVCLQFDWREMAKRTESTFCTLYVLMHYIIALLPWSDYDSSLQTAFFQDLPNSLSSLPLHHAVLWHCFPLDPNFPLFTWHAQICRVDFLQRSGYTTCDCLCSEEQSLFKSARK